MRVRRRYLAIPVFLMMLTAILMVHFDAATQPTSRIVASSPSPYCRKGDILAGVYNPLRFRVLSNCQIASGLVKSITTQNDDDRRIDVILDAQYTKLLDTGKVNSQNGVLVLELISQDQPTVPAPTVGQHVTFVGPWVYDIENQWNAICPVWSITTS